MMGGFKPFTRLPIQRIRGVVVDSLEKLALLGTVLSIIAIVAAIGLWPALLVFLVPMLFVFHYFSCRNEGCEEDYGF